jgi:hypothetical protein
MSAPGYEEPLISCIGGCDKKLTEQQAELMGWQRLPITGRMRCGACTRQLEIVGRIGSEKKDEQ